MNPFTRTVIDRNGNLLFLTSKEFDLLYFLYSHKGQVFTKEQLYENVWGFENMPKDTSNLPSFIRKLRKRQNPTQTIRYILLPFGVLDINLRVNLESKGNNVETDGVIQTRWRSKTQSHASLLASVWFTLAVGRALASRSKPPLSNKGGTKNKRQYTLLSGKRCFYKAKLLLTGS